MVTIKTKACVMCHKSTDIEITETQALLYSHPQRPNIQEIFPDWAPEQRELLITGTHAECWDELMSATHFTEEDEEDV